MTDAIAEPKLAKPGAGLPFAEWFVAKYIILPRKFKTTTKQSAIEEFRSQSNHILAKAKLLDSKQLIERRLVPPQRGLEDSSRYWSVAMALDHLVIVGDLMRQVIAQLASGKCTLEPASIPAVKPSKVADGAEAISEFNRMSTEFVESAQVEIDRFPNAKYAHPWFGPLNAHEWLVMAGLHQKIHREQIEQIVRRL